MILDVLGYMCKVLLPIPEETYLGNPDASIAICTLSSMNLLKKLSNSEIMSDVSIIGRLLSENKGIEALIQSVMYNPKISTIIMCGLEVWGHKAGHSLLCLYNHGISSTGRIIGSHSPDPILTVTTRDVEQFQKQVTIIDKIGQKDHNEIIRLVHTLT